MNLKSYVCDCCGNDTFYMVQKRVQGGFGSYLGDVLRCTRCGGNKHIEPCNTHGLKLSEGLKKGRIQTGSKWKCTDEDHPMYGQTCTVREAHDHPDYNGDGDITLDYEDGTEYVGKVRRFTPSHKPV